MAIATIETKMKSAASVDVAKMREIAKALYETPSLVKEFEKDPEATAAKINGFIVPEGMHLHMADDRNVFTPAEEAGRFGSSESTDWDRVEVRAGYKTVSLVSCM